MSDPTVTLTVRLPLTLDAKLRERAAESDRPLSYLVRVAVEQYLSLPKVPRG